MASTPARSVPFPSLPDALRARFGLGALRLRAYATDAADLDVDFGDPDVLGLELTILARCTRADAGAPIPPDFFPCLDVSQRTEALLLLSALGGAPVLDVPLRCVRARCREAMEVELSVDELREVQRAATADGLLAATIGGEQILLRRPTGLDQAAWRRARYPDEATAARAMAESLVVDDLRGAFRARAAGDPGWAGTLDTVMRDGDPLVDFRMRVTCPACGAQDSYAVNLIEIVLRRLREAQQRLAAMVHRLALRYHWSEAEIFAVAPWRRERYLALLDREDAP